MGLYALIYLDNIEKCSKVMHDKILIYICYLAWFALRYVIACVSCYWTSRPHENALKLRAIFLFIDGFVLTKLLLEYQMGLERDEAIECATSNFGLTFFWGIMVVMNIAFFFVMLIAVTWCCSCLCVAVLMICTLIVSPEVLRSNGG